MRKAPAAHVLLHIWPPNGSHFCAYFLFDYNQNILILRVLIGQIVNSLLRQKVEWPDSNVPIEHEIFCCTWEAQQMPN